MLYMPTTVLRAMMPYCHCIFLLIPGFSSWFYLVLYAFLLASEVFILSIQQGFLAPNAKDILGCDPSLNIVVPLEGQNVLSCESLVSWGSCVMYTSREYLWEVHLLEVPLGLMSLGRTARSYDSKSEPFLTPRVYD